MDFESKFSSAKSVNVKGLRLDAIRSVKVVSSVHSEEVDDHFWGDTGPLKAANSAINI